MTSEKLSEYERARDFYLSLPLPEPEVRHNLPGWLQVQPWCFSRAALLTGQEDGNG